MPSTRPFISFLFGSLTAGSSNATTSTTSSPSPFGGNRNVPPSRVNPVSIGAASATTAASIPATTAPTGIAPTQSATLGTSPTSVPTPSYPIPQKPNLLSPHYNERRNSASSLNGDKWWIGGISSDGSERYYRLQPLPRNDSFDGLSMDRLSI